MKFQLYGKIISRTSRKVKKTDGSTYDLYQIVVEEPGQFPSRFQLGSKNAAIFGQKDGPFAVGKFVNAAGFIDGKEREAVAKDGHKFTTYPVWFTLTSLTSPASPVPADSSAGEELADDIPF